jgi:hypothetical protein
LDCFPIYAESGHIKVSDLLQNNRPENVKKDLRVFFEGDAARARTIFAAWNAKIAHFRSEKCVFRRTSRRKTRILTFFAPAGANSARLCAQHKRKIAALQNRNLRILFFRALWYDR